MTGRSAAARAPHRGAALRWLLRVLAGLAVVALAWPAQFGGLFTITAVSGHSMTPALHDGDLVLARHRAQYRPGQIVVYTVPSGAPGAGGHVVHRLTSRAADGSWTTRGDNKAGPDPWHPTDADILGAQTLRVPRAGVALLLLLDPRLLSVGAGALVCAALWPRQDPARR